LFSANVDDTVFENLAHVTAGSQLLADHPAVIGVLTNSHLTLQSKHEGPGRDDPRRGNPVTTPSKDLRILDPALDKVIIVDDNPTRLFQHRNVRVFKKLRNEIACDPDGLAHFEAATLALLDEITNAARHSANGPSSFVDAYQPWSMTGMVAMSLLRASGLDETAARELVRTNPDWVDPDF